MRAKAEAPETFVGREDDLAVARSVVDAALDRRGSLLLVGGEPGIGKSRFAEALAQRGRRRAQIISTTCWDDPGQPPLWPWMQILRSCINAVGRDEFTAAIGPRQNDLSRLLPDILSGGDDVAPEGPTDQLRFRLFESVCAALALTARIRPLLIVIDDLQWADATSLRLLAFAANELRGERVALIGCHRLPYADVEGETSDLLSELPRRGHAHLLRGLNTEEVGRVLTASTGLQPSSELVKLIHERTRGNPLFVREVGKLLAAQEALDERAVATAIPDSVRGVIARRLAQLSEACVSILTAAAVTGQRFSPDLVGRVTGENHETVASLLAEAEHLGIVVGSSDRRRYEFLHALVRDVLYEGIPPPDRVSLHRRTGEALEQSVLDGASAPDTDLTHHFLHAGDPRKALSFARAAGEKAMRTVAYDEALRNFELSLELSDAVSASPRERLDIMLSLGDARMKTGDWPGAVALFDDAATHARTHSDAHGLARAALGMAGGLGFEVRLFDEKQIGLLNEALEIVGPLDSSLRSWLLARLSIALSFIESPRRRVDLAREAIDIARRINDERALAYALATECDALSDPDHVDTRIAHSAEITSLARTNHDLEMELLGRRLRIVALLEKGEVSASDDEIDAYEERAESLRQPIYSWYVPLWRGMRAMMRGDLSEAEGLQTTAARIGERAHSQNAEILVNAQRITLWREEGRVQEACDLCENYFRPSRFPSARAWMAGLLAHAGRRVEAHGILDRFADDGLDVPFDAEWTGALCMAAEGCGTVDHKAAAQRILDALHPYAEEFAVDGIAAACFGSVSRYLGILAGVTERYELAEEHFARALRANRKAGATLLVGHTLRQQAEMRLRLGRPADGLLEEALEIYRSLDNAFWIDATQALAPRSEGAPETSPESANVFRKEGDLWTLSFRGHGAWLKDAKGLGDIRRLLERPNQEIHAFDLMATDSRTLGAAPRSDSGDVIDAAARAAYKRRLAELEDDVADAEMVGDLGRAARAQAERDAIVSQLAAAYGLGNRSRKLADPQERARAAVTWRIRAAVQRIEKEHPALGRHLSNTIKTGTYCSYTPDEPIEWNTGPADA